MKKEIGSRAAKIGSLCLLMATALAVHAESQPEDIIKYRQNVMKSNGAHTAAIAAIVQGKVEYKDRLADHAKAVQTFTKNIPALFPPGSDFGDTEALDSVWKNRAGFEKAAKNTEQKAAALAQAAAKGDPKSVGPKLKELADSCKACHKDFRKEEQK